MPDQIGQTACLDPVYDLLGGERPFARGTPDIDPMGVQHQHP